jgi:hypothetical protein
MPLLGSAVRRWAGLPADPQLIRTARLLEAPYRDAYIATTIVGSKSTAPAGLSAVRWEEGGFVGRGGVFGLILRNELGYREAGGTFFVDPVDERRSSIRAEVRILARNPRRDRASFEHEVESLLDQVIAEMEKRLDSHCVS